MIKRLKIQLILILLIYPSYAYAQVTMTIPDPYDPVKRLPLDSMGRVECLQSKLDESSAAACTKAKKFYALQFSNPDLRLSKMIDHIRPHPKHLIHAFLTPKGVKCGSRITGEKKQLCLTAKQIFKSLDSEEQQSLINELDEKLDVMMLVPLDGELDCSWSNLKKDKYAFCLKQNEHLKKMLFEQRLAHNEKAMMIIQLLHELQQQKNDCK